MQQQLKAGDRNEFNPSFLILWHERNQNIYLYTADKYAIVHSGVILSTVGKTMQIPLHTTKTYLHFSLKSQPMSEWEKISV